MAATRLSSQFSSILRAVEIPATFEEEAEIDLDAVKREIATLESQLATVRGKMAHHLKELGL